MDGVDQVSDVDAARQIHNLCLTIDSEKLRKSERMYFTGISSSEAGREGKRVEKRYETAAAIYVGNSAMLPETAESQSEKSDFRLAITRKRCSDCGMSST